MKKTVIIILLLCLLSAVFSGCGTEQTETVQRDTQPVESGSEEPDIVREDSFGTFKTVDLDNNEVTEELFAQKEYTMVNVWGTFCPPCIKEMPELEELNGSLPDNFQLIGLVVDLPYGTDSPGIQKAAEDIVKETGVTYPNLRIWEEGVNLIASYSSFVPTTFFVDSEGTILGDPIIGADIDAYKNRIHELEQ